MKKTNLNNKGFSLVELIIVVAIMAVLVGVLAPVYLQYLERTNKSADVSAVADMMNAMETTLIDNVARGNDTDHYEITFTNGSAAIPADIQPIISGYDLKGQWEDTSGNVVSGGTLYANYTAGQVTFEYSANSVFAIMNDEYASVGDKMTTSN